MSFEPALSLTEQIADHLGEKIISGQLAPGSRVQELKAAAELGVSRGSVREALLLLERRHLIEIIPRRGAVVSGLGGREIDDLAELLGELKTRLFVKLVRTPQADLSACRRAVEAMAQAVSSGRIDALLRARRDFFEGAVAEIDDFYLGAVLRGLVPAGLRVAYRAAGRPDFEARDTLRYHQALLDALDNRDEARVRELVAAFTARERRLASDAAGLAPPPALQSA